MCSKLRYKEQLYCCDFHPLDILSLEGWVDFGEEETRKTMFSSGLANHQFDIFLEDFRYSEARVRVIERMALSKDIIW